MGCATSGPVKDLAAAAAENAPEKVKDAMNNAMDDASNLDFDKAQEDLMEVGEGLKGAMEDGVNEMIDSVLGRDEEREDGDGENGQEEEAPAGDNAEEPEAGDDNQEAVVQEIMAETAEEAEVTPAEVIMTEAQDEGGSKLGGDDTLVATMDGDGNGGGTIDITASEE